MPITLSYAHAVKTIIDDVVLDKIKDTTNPPFFKPNNNATNIEQLKKGAQQKTAKENQTKESSLFENDQLHQIFTQTTPRNYTITGNKSNPIDLTVQTTTNLTTAIINIEQQATQKSTTIHLICNTPTMLVFNIKNQPNTSVEMQLNITSNHHPLFIHSNIIVANNSTIHSQTILTTHSELFFQRTIAHIHESASFTEQTYATASKTSYVDTKTTSILENQNSQANVTFKGVVYDAAKIITQSNTIVTKNANNSKAKEKSEILIIDPSGKAEAIPQLEVYNDNTQCSHSGSITQINPEKLFFLESRGISKLNAQQMIIDGFLNKNIETLE